jgi:hypothetical protein
MLMALATIVASAAPALGAPTITIESPTGGSVTKDRKPTVAGQSSDPLDTVTVTVFSEGSPLQTLEAQPQPLSGEWGAEVPKALDDGPYVLVAEQTELLTGESGQSSPVEFAVHASKPVVTLNAVSSPTKDSTPSFSGTASEATEVTVSIYEGSSVSGSPVAEAHASGTGGSWSSGGATPVLADGTYTAVAEQESSFENGPGVSEERTFTVHTAKPSVTLNAVSSPTKDSTPSFSGTASEKTPVTVSVFEGSTATGLPLAEAHASGTGGSWSSGGASPALADGTYTAIAEQESAFGNGPGSSQERTFTVHTAKPVVTLNTVSSPTKDATPSFSGTASETTEITVSIYKGSSVSGSPVAEAHASGTGGSWSSEGASPALADGTYTAVAEQESAFGDGPGSSEERTFTVHTAKPVVTLNAVSSPTKDSTPSFSGTASEKTPVTVSVFEGSTASGSPVAEAHASGTGGSWSSAGASPALADGTYTAVAEQESAFGDGPGSSEERTFTVHTAKPAVTLNAVSSPTKDSTPSFTGTASETTEVTVSIYNGSSVSGSPVAEAHASGTGGSWSSGGAAPALADGTYTAVAEQESAFGDGPGSSEERTFTVHTAKPVVTLNAVSSPTKDSTPSFSGTASEKTPVTVSVFAAGDVGGTVVAEAHATGTGGSWSSGGASPALADGAYTAVAEQESAFGNGPGSSQERTFTVHTAKPVVTLNAVSSPTKDSTPSFTGTANEKTSVKVQIYKGFSASGSPVASATASGTGGSWSSGGAAPALADGTYTAVAEQESAFGDGPGSSEERTFTVDTKPPSVTLDPISSPGNDSTPGFSGSASDTTEVTVRIFKGSSASGTPSAEAHATGTGGGWSSGAASPALADGSYTAVAVQESSRGTGEGVSEAIHFTIDTAPPHVTLGSVTSPSGNTTPSFSGTASDTTPVTVNVYAGANAEGAVVATAGATGTGGSWSSGNASPSLPSGEYTARAEQSSSLGNGVGRSNADTFVVDTSSPTVTLNGIASPSNDSTPTFSGTASDTTTVVVHVFDSGNKEVASASGSPSKGGWKSGALSKTLPSGSYRAVASQASSLGNPVGMSAPISFVVETESPRVTLDQPPARSSINTPHFTGSASDTTQVKVVVFEGTDAKGSPIATLETAVSGGQFSTANISALPDGKYTAIAEQPSSVGNAAGHSPERTFEIVTKAPSVTFAAVKTPSNNTKPSFSGTASDTTGVHIAVFQGTSPEGTLVAEAEAAGTGGSWTSGVVSKALTEGTYTAIAQQPSSVAGAGTGTSNSVTFVVQTRSPTVTLNGVKSPLGSKETTPVFSGTATDPTGVVVVHVFEGTTEVAQTKPAKPSGGGWSATSPALPEGLHTFTAIATQESAVGNPPGSSPSIKFTVDTTSPTLTITPIAARSNNRTPTFSGTVKSSDPKPRSVVVHVFEGATEVAKAEATPSGEKWTSTALAHPLAEAPASYTAYATETSSLENPEGRSSSISFEVDAEPPLVTIDPIAGASNNFSPAFSGTTNEAGEVTVAVYAGPKPSGTPVRTVKGDVTESAPGKWSWVSPEIAKLEERAGQYTAVATQKSALGNPDGKSAPLVFRVDPGSPILRMSVLPTQMNMATPAFSGTSDQSQPVTVRVYSRAAHATNCAPEGVELAQAIAPRGGAWVTAAASPALADGEYAAIASEPGAVSGTAETVPACFAVDTRAPSVLLAFPGAGAALTGGTVSPRGTAGTSDHDKPQVTIQLFAGTSTAAAPMQQVVVNSVSGNWSAVLSGVAPGTYTVRAEQSDDAGNVGVSNSSTFTEVAAASSGPSATFAWYPVQPHTGERITLVSNSTDVTSPITGYAWNLGGPAFVAGGQSMSTSFNSAGGHIVQLQVTDVAGRASLASETIPVTYPLMRPFPVIRIVTTRAVGRVRLKLLSVQAPPGASVQVTCAGKGCPSRSQTRTVLAGHKAAVTPLAFPRFERSLPPGAVLRIRVYRNGVIGKYTTFRIRRGKLPVRGDSCVSSTDPKPIACAP